MREFFNQKYYTLDKIPKYRLDFMELKLKEFISLLDLKPANWPLDCVKLIIKIKVEKLFPLDYRFDEMPDECDGFSDYIPDIDKHIIFINKKKAIYPFQFSNHRRLNFTLAHELGHIILGHNDIPSALKSEEEKKLENLEADEFAGRLLIPEKLIVNCHLVSLAETAKYFMVSKTALWTRLNNMKRLDLLNSSSGTFYNSYSNSISSFEVQ